MLLKGGGRGWEKAKIAGKVNWPSGLQPLEAKAQHLQQNTLVSLHLKLPEEGTENTEDQLPIYIISQNWDPGKNGFFFFYPDILRSPIKIRKASCYWASF